MADRLINLFTDELMVELGVLSDESTPDNTESWDSLAAMRLVAAIEEEFDITLSTVEIMKMRSIGIVRQVLREKDINI